MKNKSIIYKNIRDINENMIDIFPNIRDLFFIMIEFFSHSLFHFTEIK